jgi:predicted DNA-binding transcriptional regulator YafY
MARGVRMGRKPLLSAQQTTHARKLIEQGESPGHVGKSLKVSRRTLYRALAATNLCYIQSGKSRKI